MVVWFPICSARLSSSASVLVSGTLPPASLGGVSAVHRHVLPLLPTPFLVGTSASPAGMEARAQGRGAGRRVTGGPAPWPHTAVFGKPPGLGEKQIGGHMESHGVQPRGPWRTVLVLRAAGLRGGGMRPSRAQGFLFPSAAFPALPACWNVSGLGIFTARIFPSQSHRFQLEPGDSSAWAGAAGEGRGACWGTPPAPLWGPGPHSHPSWEMQTPVSPGGQAEPGLLELQLRRSEREASGTRNSPSARRELRPAVSHEPHFLQPVSQEGAPPQIPSSGGAVAAQPRFSGLWGPTGPGRRWHC